MLRMLLKYWQNYANFKQSRMELSKLIFKKEQFRLALVGVTECFNDVYRYNYGCEGDCSGCCEGMCTESCAGCCDDMCAVGCTDSFEGDCV